MKLSDKQKADIDQVIEFLQDLKNYEGKNIRWGVEYKDDMQDPYMYRDREIETKVEEHNE